MPAHKRVELGICQAPEGRGIFPGMTRAWRTSRWAATPARTARARAKQDDLERVFSLFPRLLERRKQAGRHAVGRRAADAGHRPGAHGAARGCCCSTSRRWAWRRCSSPRSSRSSARSTSRAPRSCWSSRTPRRRCARAERAYVLETGRIVKEGVGRRAARRRLGDRRLPRSGLASRSVQSAHGHRHPVAHPEPRRDEVHARRASCPR